MTTGFLVLLIIQRIILYVCLYDRPRANWTKNRKLHSNHNNDDCYMNLHVQRFASAILIDFVVITLCFTCLSFTFNSAVSSVVTDIFWCHKNWLPNIYTNNITLVVVNGGFWRIERTFQSFCSERNYWTLVNVTDYQKQKFLKIKFLKS